MTLFGFLTKIVYGSEELWPRFRGGGCTVTVTFISVFTVYDIQHF